MFDSLTDHLQGAFKAMRGEDKLTPENIEDAIREVRKALLEADVSLKVVKLFISRIRQKALGFEVLQSVSPGQQFIKVVYDELVAILGGENVPLTFKGDPAIVMLVGLQGSGKTTACGKLALKLKTEGNKPLLVACDIQRPAAIMQLETLGKQIDVPVFTLPKGSDVFDISKAAIAEAKQLGLSPVILDTAGRLQVDTELMAEVLLLDRAFEPCEKLLVVDAMTGQEAVNVAETFNTQLDVTGIILTKIDGDARGGACLSVKEAVGKPIKFISTGEKLDALEAFHPDRMASRILSMGDVVTLVEKAKDAIDEKEAERVAKQMLGGDFTLEVFVSAQRMMKKMGPMGDIMKMMGIGGMLGINSDQQKMLANEGESIFNRYEVAINSMTPDERRRPEIIDMRRRRRIAGGAGLPENEIGKLLNEFEQMRGIFKQLRKMLGNFSGFPGGGGSDGAAADGGLDLGSLLGGGLFGGGGAKPNLGPGGAPFPGMTKRAAPPPKAMPLKMPGSGYYGKKKKKR